MPKLCIGFYFLSTFRIGRSNLKLSAILNYVSGFPHLDRIAMRSAQMCRANLSEKILSEYSKL